MISFSPRNFLIYFFDTFPPFHYLWSLFSGTPIRWVLDLCTAPLNLPSFLFSTFCLVLFSEISMAWLGLYLRSFKNWTQHLILVLQLFFFSIHSCSYFLVAILFYFTNNINNGCFWSLISYIIVVSRSLSFLFALDSLNFRDFLFLKCSGSLTV